MDVDKIKLQIIKAGEKAVKQLIKVAEEDIIKYGEDDELAADKLKNAAATKKLAIFDAFEILTRIELEKNLIEGNDSSSQKKTVEGFAERRSK
jgi:ASC-1-like (ASCH) protein